MNKTGKYLYKYWALTNCATGAPRQNYLEANNVYQTYNVYMKITYDGLQCSYIDTALVFCPLLKVNEIMDVKCFLTLKAKCMY